MVVKENLISWVGQQNVLSLLVEILCSLVTFQTHSLSVDYDLMFNDGGKGWSWTERVVSSQYACTYF